MKIASWNFWSFSFYYMSSSKILLKSASHRSTFTDHKSFLEIRNNFLTQVSIIKWDHLLAKFLFVPCQLHNHWIDCENFTWRNFVSWPGFNFSNNISALQIFSFDFYWLDEHKVSEQHSDHIFHFLTRGWFKIQKNFWKDYIFK